MFLIHEDPSVLASECPTPIFLGSPSARFHRVASFHVPLCTAIHESVQLREDFLGHADTEVVAPAADDRIELVDQGDCGRAHMFAPNPFELPSQLLNRTATRLDQQFVTAA